MSPRSLLATILISIGALSVSGCGPTLWIGLGAQAGVAAAEERSIGTQVDDAGITIAVNEELFRYNEKLFQEVSVDVTEGRVLLAGVVDTPEDRVDAVRLTWQADGVKEVMNEIKVTKGSSTEYANDVWISTQLRNDLLWDKEIASINYNVETVHGTVYITGLARSQAELTRVIAHARTIASVREIVSYVRVITSTGTTGYAASG